MSERDSIIALADKLSNVVEIIMQPQTAQQARLEAYMTCERFKEESPFCAQVGLLLASGVQFSQNVKHFGLQLVEHTIKFKWNCIIREEKLFIKENAMKLLLMGVGPAEEKNLLHLKDALSRIIVEMIKREWPQQWTTLFSELSDACSKGESQTELVLLIFLRLVEDVALLQTIESNQRRKDMYQALINNMNDIFDFFLRLIELHVSLYHESSKQHYFQKASAHSRIVEVVLLAIAGFVEWVPINHITSNNCKLLHILCILLNDEAFQCNAAECLSQMSNRKGQIKERKPLLLLFGKEYMQYIIRASQMQISNASLHALEQNLIFLKKMLHFLNGLTQQLILLFGQEYNDSIQRISDFEIYLECILHLTRHASLNVTHGAVLIWNILLKHDNISKDSRMISYIPKIIEVVAPRIIRIPYPRIRSLSRENCIASTSLYICLEYDSEEEFAIFFYRCRADFLELFRQTTMVQPLVTFAYCEQWLNMRLAKAITEKSDYQCSVLDPCYLEWEAVVMVIDGVLSRVLLVSDRPSVQTGLHLLEECLKMDSENPLIMSILLSCISALFVFLSMSSCQITTNNYVTVSGVTLLSRVLEKIFSALIFKDNSDFNSQHLETTTRVQACKNLRRHAASLIVKLGHKYPLLLLPVFDQIYKHIKNLLSNPEHSISKMERITLQEALLLISNHFCDYERQCSFISEIMQESLSRWNAFSVNFQSVSDFMHFVGLDQPDSSIEENITCNSRNSLIDALYVVLGVIKRCTWPDDPDRASRGGFVVGFTDVGNPICRNPASPHVIPLLPYILSLLRILNELFKPEAIAKLSHSFRNIYSMLEHEKKTLMGICGLPVYPLDPLVKKVPTPFDKMQQFMTLLFEGCYHLMGSIGSSLGRDFYQLEGVADALINSAFTCLDDVPDYRLRPIIRVFLKPFIFSCPPAFYDSVLIPILNHLSPLMYNRLKTHWTYISSLYESGQLNDDEHSNDDTQEVLEDMLNRTLTREYLDVLKIALVGGQIGVENSLVHPTYDAAINTDVIMEPEEHSVDSVTHVRTAQIGLLSDIINDLGSKLLRNNLTGNYILMTILNALSWNDSICNLKAVNLASPVMRFLNVEHLVDVHKAVSAFTAVLQGLRVHGQHEANQAGLVTLGVQFYEVLRPKFPIIIDILHNIPNVNNSDINKFDEKVSTAPIKGTKVDKAKKDIFKKLTAPLVGCSVNQLFRHEII